jgi:hypothetical protein
MHEEEYRIHDEMTDHIAFLEKTDEDTIYFHEFIKAIVKEMNDHIVSKNWELVPSREVPSGVKVLYYVLDMYQKIYILTRKVIDYKARLNVHGGQ